MLRYRNLDLVNAGIVAVSADKPIGIGARRGIVQGDFTGAVDEKTGHIFVVLMLFGVIVKQIRFILRFCQREGSVPGNGNQRGNRCRFLRVGRRNQAPEKGPDSVKYEGRETAGFKAHRFPVLDGVFYF